MTETISDIQHTFAARDCQVHIFRSGTILIINSTLEDGSITTSSKKKAKELLITIASVGDIIHWGAVDYMDGLI